MMKEEELNSKTLLVRLILLLETNNTLSSDDVGCLLYNYNLDELEEVYNTYWSNIL